MQRQVSIETTKESAQPEIFNCAGLLFDFGHGLESSRSPVRRAGRIKTGDVIAAIDGKAPDDEMNQRRFFALLGTHLRLTVKQGTKNVT